MSKIYLFAAIYFLGLKSFALEEFDHHHVMRITKHIYQGAVIKSLATKERDHFELIHIKWGLSPKLEHERFEKRLLDRNGQLSSESISKEIFDYYQSFGHLKLIEDSFASKSKRRSGLLSVRCITDVPRREKTCKFIGSTRFNYQNDKAYLTLEYLKEAYKRQKNKLKTLSG